MGRLEVLLKHSDFEEKNPTSSVQERMYTLHCMNPERLDYNVTLAATMEGNLDVERLQKALAYCLKCNPILTARFHQNNGMLFYQIRPEVQLEVEKVHYEVNDYHSFENMRKNESSAFIRPFRLFTDELLVRARLISYVDEKYLLLLDFHHIIFDGTSVSIFMHDLQSFYNHPGCKIEKKYNYSNFVNWQKKYIESDEYIRKQEYWKEVLSTETSLCDVLIDYPNKGGEALASASYKTELFNYQEIDELCHCCGITKYTFFTGIFSFIFSKLTFQTDITLGTLVSGKYRFKKQLDSVVGMFVNTLLIRNDISDDISFSAFLTSVQETVNLVLQNSEVLYETILDTAGAKKKNTPLFDICFRYQDSYSNMLQLDNISCSVEEIIPLDCVYNLTLMVNVREQSFEVVTSYAKDLFQKSTIERLLDLFVETIDTVLRNKDVALKDIPISSIEDKKKILEKFNDTIVDYPKDKTAVQLFEEQVKKTPNHIAIVFAEEQLTYKELNAKANTLARKLRRLGVGCDDYVAIIAERSMELIVGICGIIKAGGAYVPIDPADPLERIQYIFEDCCPKVVLTHQVEVEALAPVIDLMKGRSWENEYENPTHVNQASDLIYCIYTSGTTGKPKGVMIEHKSVIRLVKNSDYISLDEDTVILPTGAISFDASTFELWGALLNGGKLILTDREVITNDQELKFALERYAVNTIWMTSTLFNQLIQVNEALFDELKYVLIGGEQLSVDHVRMLRSRDNKVTVINGYGPTENTTFTTTYEIPNRFVKTLIGQPIANTQVYIMNGDQLCGIGVPGELCIAGDGLARGYLKQPELTKEKFVDNPFGENKLYRSGDLAKWLPDGNIEYLGRKDEQVKIRGYRIELGEIENAIRELEGIKDCIVITREDASGEKAIYAYLVSDTEISQSSVRDQLVKKLPEYMIPVHLMRIGSIPITKNGKLDKRALPEIETRAEKEYVAPRTETEEKMAALFEEILGVHQIGVKDSFFELGGHSLRATKLVNRVEAETGVRIPLKEVFSNPTIETLGKVVNKSKNYKYLSISKAKEQEYYEMSSAQKRMYMIQEKDPEAVTYNMPQYLELTGEVCPEKIASVLQGLVDRYEILRTAFMMLEDEFVQQVQERLEVDFEYVQETLEDEERVISEFVKPFDLNRPSQLRAKLVNMGAYHLLMLDMHHIISDGMSRVTFAYEFSELYNGKTLVDLTHQFKDYSEWMNRRDLSSQRDYWIKEFSDEIPLLDLPLDYIRPQVQSFEGAMIAIETGKEFGKRFKAFARQKGVTEYMVFLASAMVFLGIYANQEDVIIGSPISGRTHKDTEKMLGMFVNTLAIRGQPEREKSFEHLLEKVKRSSLKAYENQEYPFEELVELVGFNRDLSRNPLFDVMLALQNNEEAEFRMKGISSKYLEVDSRVAKFDLMFDIWEANGSFKIALEYCTALFKKETAEQMLNHYKQLLSNLLTKPDAKLKEISMITKVEEHLILDEFNNTDVGYPKDKTVVQLFEEQVERAPESIAVIFEEVQLTYKEVNERANALAHKLRELGVEPNDYVAIMAERSMEMVIGVYAIIKAGGAYVPIDPTYPKERINYILKDCRPKALLTYHMPLDNGEEGSIPTLDLSNKNTFMERVENPERVNEVNDLIYLIYTSGTTGRPKGVMVKHQTTINALNWLQRKYPINEKDVILQKTNYTFDVFTNELFWGMMFGSKVVLLEPGAEKDPIEVADVIAKERITMVNFVPTMFSIFLTSIEEKSKYIRKLSSLKYIMLAGEALDPDLVTRCYLILFKTRTKLINLYGPTEAFYVTYYECGGSEPFIPIGKPISNTQVYILNGDVLCGIGVPGELCIAGDGLARGYLNLPELTKEKFVNNPFREGKLYRSGDLAKWLPDGNIEYLGRIDEQVKIRGFRIELGEIESAIREIEEVKDCVVISKADSSGDKAIYAYLVSDLDLSVSRVRDRLGRLLPDYMIPAYIMQIDSIPITSNGKLDKQALPVIEMRTEKEFVPPRTEVEEKLGALFEEILGVERISVKDSFFELGGHSLRATKLVNRIEAETGVRISLKKVFSNPTLETLAELVMETKGMDYIPIPKAKEQEYYEMSSAQKRIYLIQEMVPEAVTYNLPQYLKLTGEVRPEKIKSAMQGLVDRHEILRTAFMMLEDELLQTVQERIEVDFEYVQETQEDEERWKSELVKPFDLGKASQLRVKLINMSGYHLLMIDMHHIISDGMSMVNFINEFTEMYNGKPLVELTHQFKDYSEWMRDRQLSSQRDYWVKEFSNEIPVLDIPLDYVRPKEQSFEGAMIELEAGKELSGKIKSIARQKGVTEYMVFLASAMVLLGAYANQEDVVIGSPISGRTHQDTEKMLGMFVNTLAMRGRPEREKSFECLLEEVKWSSLRAYENQEYPFEELVESVAIKRDLSRNPLFDVMLVLQNNEETSFRMNGVSTEYTEVASRVAKFDLMFNIWETDGSFRIALEYCSALFKKETAELLLKHYRSLLSNLLETPDIELKRISMITKAEEQLILEEFNDTDVDYPRGKTVVQLFEEQVENSPDHVAVVFEKEQLTYKELNVRANALAYQLRELGVGPDDYVAIIAERSLQMIVGLCGVIKAGGAYVPIDPTQPLERIQYMLKDSNPKIVLTYQVEVETSYPIMDLGEAEVWEDVFENPTHVNQAKDLIYCIYTSGTTGKPKGVMIEHKSVIRLAKNPDYIPLDEETVILQTGAISFDASTFEIWGAFLNGGKLILINREDMTDDQKLKNALEKHEVNTMWMTSTLFNQLIQMDETLFDGLKYVLIGGEQLSVAHVRMLKNRDAKVTVINGYGPTENTTFTLTYEVPKSFERIPIGRPISNTRVYIMNEDMLCGIGVPGELCIAGAGLARGYLNQPELTKEKFVDNPYREGKLYRSGDLVRWLPDGNIEYLGRMDEQVKIRGFRIELGEVESVIRELEEVKDCAVISREDSSGEKAIYAYMTSDAEISGSKIKDKLVKLLPDYMIPAYITQVGSIPLTKNGKLDKRALPEIEIRTEKPFTPPRTEVEEKLCVIFEEILNVYQFGVKDSFFELGGHSLRATRLVNRIEAETGVRIPLKEVFSNPTVEALAELVMETKGVEYVPIPKAEEKDYYTMSSAQMLMYQIQQMDPESTIYNMPQNFKISGEVCSVRIKRALQSLIDRHEILRTAFAIVEDDFVQCVQERAVVDFEYVKEAQESEEEWITEFVKPFDLERASQLRAKLINRGAYHLLMIDMHHIISDGMSMVTFIHEFAELYNGKILEELTHQFKDYSEWMRDRNLSDQRDYWLGEFSNGIPVLDLPLDYERPKEQSFEGALVEIDTGKKLASKIKELARQKGMTEYMVFLASAMVLLGAYANQEDVAIGSLISGRIHQDTEKMLGMFINVLVMRGQPEREKCFERLLAEVKASSLKAYENQEYPFEELVESIEFKEDPSRNPLFDVMLVLQNNEATEFRMEGLLVEHIKVSSQVAKFDLTFNIWEGANGFRIALEYCTMLFKEETAKRMLEHYTLLLRSLMERPRVKLKEASTLIEIEE